MISFEVLQVIDSIERKGSFAAAAEELFRVPSALTYTVKKAEEQLTIKIFDRDGQRAKLTPAGQLLLSEGREVLARLHRLEEQAKRVDSGWETQLRIVVDTILPVEPIYPLIQQLLADHPWLSIQVLEEALSGSWEALINQRADLVIGLSDNLTGMQWERAELGRLSMGLFCGANHPAAQLTSPVELQHLEGFSHIVINDSARQIATRDVGMLGLKQTLTVPNMQQKLSAMLANLGVSHLPCYVATPYLETGQLKQIQLNQSQNAQSMFMVWPKQGTGKANQCLREMILNRKVFQSVLTSA